MSDAAGTPLSELLAQWKARNVRVPADVGAFVVLEVTEGLLGGPAVLGASDVRVAEDGAVTLPTSRVPASPEDAARAITALLGSVLVAAGSVAPPALVRVAEAAPPTGASCLDRLRDDLEAALVPLNRQAARRVLARLVRESRRELARAAEPASPVERLDRELGPLVTPRAGAGPAQAADPIDALLADTADAQATLFEGAPSTLLPATEDPATIAMSSPGNLEAPPEAPEGEPPRPPAERAAGPSRRRDPPRPTEPSTEDGERAVSGDPPTRGGTLGYVAAFVTVALLSGAALLALRPDLLARLRGEPAPPERHDASPARLGTLTIATGATDAEVLRFVGRAPVTLSALSSASSSEIVAVLEGHAAARSVIGPGERGADEVPSVELTLAPLVPGADPLALGTPLRSGSSPLGVGEGRARVVTRPAGAKVHLVVGRGPEVRLEGLPTDEVIELLVAAEGYATERLLVAPSDWTESEDGGLRASLHASLRASD
jgi:hypothetical protein